MNISQSFDNCTNRECQFGLIPSQQMIEVSTDVFEYIIYHDVLKALVRIWTAYEALQNSASHSKENFNFFSL